MEKGIGFLLGHEEPETKRVSDLYYLDKVKRIIEGPPRVATEPLGQTVARTAPVLNLGATGKIKEAAKGFKSRKEFENHLINSPTKRDHERAFNMGNKILKGGSKPKPMKITNYIDKMNHLYSNEAKNEKTVKQLTALKEWSQPKPVGLGDNYKSDIRTPVQKKRDSYNAKVAANKAKADPTKGAHYSPWYERMAAEEAEALNEVKRTTWEQGGKVKPEPKYVTAQDVKNVYEPQQPEATPLQMKQLHKRLQNHNERTGEFKSTVEKPTHKPRFLHDPVTNELEDTYDPNWGEDILNDKK